MRIHLSVITMMIVLGCLAQRELTSNYMNYHLVDRFEIMDTQLSNKVFTSVKPFRRDAVYFNSLVVPQRSGVDSFNKNYLIDDNFGYGSTSSSVTDKPIFNTFYKRKSALYLVDHNDYAIGEHLFLIVNPILGFEASLDMNQNENLYRNSRGALLRGNIGQKLGFYTMVQENQYRLPKYIRQQVDETGVVPGAGLHKPFGSNGEDFFNVSGYVTFSPIKEIMVQFGHDRNFIGNGYRSLILSDYGKEYPFLKINTKVWKINYMNLFMQHIDFQGYNDKAPTARKYSAFHHLSINIGKHLNIGLFENVVFDRQDSAETDRFEFNYLNPLIFYRAVEHGLNSSDNVLLGLDWKWNFLKRFSFYGQVVLDEFVKNELFKLSDVYENKYAYQAGLKYINVANINNLDLQLEMNQVRPYTYSHNMRSQNWVNYNQSLAHPLGANFREMIGIVRYQPINKLQLTGFISYSKQGVDSNLTAWNYGGTVIRSNIDVPDRDNVPMFQGLMQEVLNFNLMASYMLWHNLFMDARIQYRTATVPTPRESIDATIFSLGLRLNTGIARFD